MRLRLRHKSKGEGFVLAEKTMVGRYCAAVGQRVRSDPHASREYSQEDLTLWALYRKLVSNSRLRLVLYPMAVRNLQ